jgi:hypothetical protein
MLFEYPIVLLFKIHLSLLFFFCRNSFNFKIIKAFEWFNYIVFVWFCGCIVSASFGV